MYITPYKGRLFVNLCIAMTILLLPFVYFEITLTTQTLFILFLLIIISVLNKYRRWNGKPSVYNTAEYFTRLYDTVSFDKKENDDKPLIGQLDTVRLRDTSSIIHCTILGRSINMEVDHKNYKHVQRHTIDGSLRNLLPMDKYCALCGKTINAFERRILLSKLSACYQCFHKEQYDIRYAIIVKWLNWFNNSDIDRLIIRLMIRPYQNETFLINPDGLNVGIGSLSADQMYQNTMVLNYKHFQRFPTIKMPGIAIIPYADHMKRIYLWINRSLSIEVSLTVKNERILLALKQDDKFLRKLEFDDIKHAFEYVLLQKGSKEFCHVFS